jgi:hypothetical protein
MASKHEYEDFGYGEPLGDRAQMALDTVELKDTTGIPSWMVHVMDMEFIEDFTGHARGDFRRDCQKVYLEFQHRCGVCMIDQFLPDNPFSMEQEGFASGAARSATTGIGRIVRDGMEIDSPEAVIEHMERFEFPRLAKNARELADASECGMGVPPMCGTGILPVSSQFPAVSSSSSFSSSGRQQKQKQEQQDMGKMPMLHTGKMPVPHMDRKAKEILQGEVDVQRKFGRNILKAPYVFSIPYLDYYSYGYENYFAAYALYPEMMERAFSLQADYAALFNQAVASAVAIGHLPRLIRLDHDIADSRGPLVDVRSLDRVYFPHFARAIAPLLATGVRCIWHCDGNLMPVVPRLLEAGVGGFQGFQYEDGMDYVSICRMKDRQGGPLLIIAGVSTSRTLPHGTRQDVIDQLNWLVANGPREGLFLGASSSIVPGTNRENIRTLIEGLNYYRVHGRATQRRRDTEKEI